MEEAIEKATEERVDRKYRGFVCKLEGSIQKAHASNDRLSRQLFTLNNRIINVVEKIGFKSFDDFEEAVLDEPETWKVDSIKANYVRVLSSEEQKPQLQTYSRSRAGYSASEIFREELEQLKRQVHDLQQRSVERPGNSMKSNTPPRSPLSPLSLNGDPSRSEISRLRSELRILSRKYDSLLEAKESAEKKYKKDYKKWRDFKSWLSTKSKHAKALREQIDSKLSLADELRDSTDEGNSSQKEIAGPSRSSGSRSAEEENIRPPQPPRSRQAATEPRYSTARSSEGMLRVPKAGKFSFSASTSRSVSPSPMVGRKKKTLSEPLKLKTEVADETAMEAHNLLRETAREKGELPNAANAERTINALYTINTSRNNGLPFQFDEVVRGKGHRQRLEAGDCDCCKEYYDGLAPLPSRLAPPLWLSSPKAGDTIHYAQENSSQDEAVASHKQRISRHRFQWSPAKTPPDYWNIGFPTTQEAAEINRKAAEMHAKKRRRIEKEANTVGGRYIRRQNEAEMST